jgi:hypothetical protein
MRCYHFSYFYLSSIQQGIQAAHAQMEMFTKYREQRCDIHHITTPCEYHKQLYDWASDHKTMICLNAGMQSVLEEIKTQFEDSRNKFPWASFYEEPGAVSPVHTLTNVCIVLPEKIYDNSWMFKKPNNYLQINLDGSVVYDVGLPGRDPVEFSSFEVELIYTLNNCRLAS